MANRANQYLLEDAYARLIFAQVKLLEKMTENQLRNGYMNDFQDQFEKIKCLSMRSKMLLINCK